MALNITTLIRTPFSRCVLGLLLLCTPRTGLTKPAEEKRDIFALIIGVNKSTESARPPLRYADDDALQNRQLISQLTSPANVVLLTSPDSESRPLYRNIRATPPTRRALNSAMRALNAKMTVSKAANREPVFYFFYTGHGNVKNNEGYVTLEDGRFTRSDLMALLSGSTATKNHVVIDACKSYFMVFSRSAGGKRRPVQGVFLAKEHKLPENTGFFLSTSTNADSHEWEAFQGGIFSHEMRSALRGGADINGDRTITYEEAAAFIWQANQAIVVKRFRPRFYVHPPDNAPADTTVLADLNQADGNWLSLDSERPEHQYLEDGLGRRLLDIHPAPHREVALLLPSRRPLFIRFPATGREISLPEGESIDISDTISMPWTVSSRGAEHEAFGRLFSLPYDTETIVAYRNWQHLSSQSNIDVSPERHPWLRRAFGIGALVTGVAGLTMTSLAVSMNRRLDDTSSGRYIQTTNERIRAFNIGAVTCYGVAGAAMVTYLLWTLWPNRQIQAAVAPHPDAFLSIGGAF